MRLPRFLSNSELLDQLVGIDHQYAQVQHSGPLIIRINYAAGQPRTIQLTSKRTFRLAFATT